MKWTFAIRAIARLLVQLLAMNATTFEKDFPNNERTYLIFSMYWLAEVPVSSSRGRGEEGGRGGGGEVEVWPRTVSSLWRMDVLRILRKNVSLGQTSHQTSVRRYPVGRWKFSSQRLWRWLLCTSSVYQHPASCSSYVWSPAYSGKLQRDTRWEQYTSSNCLLSPTWVSKESIRVDSRYWSNLSQLLSKGFEDPASRSVQLVAKLIWTWPKWFVFPMSLTIFFFLHLQAQVSSYSPSCVKNRLRTRLSVSFLGILK